MFDGAALISFFNDFYALLLFLPKALAILQIKATSAPPLPSPADLKRLDSLTQLLELFHAATRNVEGDHLTLALVPSVIHDLQQKLLEAASEKDQVTRSQCALLFSNALRARFGFIFSEVNLALQAAALHPSFGHLPWITAEL